MASNLLSATKPHSANEGKCKNKRNLVTCIVFICKLKILYNFPYYNIPGIGCFTKIWFTQQDSNLESFIYESGILPLQPNLFKFIGSYNYLSYVSK